MIDRIVKLSKRFLSGKALPDSAIDILDEAGAYRELNQNQAEKGRTDTTEEGKRAGKSKLHGSDAENAENPGQGRKDCLCNEKDCSPH